MSKTVASDIIGENVHTVQFFITDELQDMLTAKATAESKIETHVIRDALRAYFSPEEVQTAEEAQA